MSGLPTPTGGSPGLPVRPPTDVPPSGAADRAPALEVDHVSAAYGPYRALFDVTFTVPAGGVVALLGSNGAGKSTVARVVSGLVPATDGRVRIDGRDMTGRPTHRIARAGVAHVPEGRGVFANLSVEENLVVSFRQRAGARGVRDALGRVYEGFPVLGERRRQRAGTLSGGQQRLLSLAKVLVVPPKLLVADELSLGLAPAVVDAVYDGLRQIHEAGVALLVVEQQVDRVLGLADRAVVLQRGAVAFDGSADEALPVLEQVLSAAGDHADLGTAAGTSRRGRHLGARGWAAAHAGGGGRSRGRGRARARARGGEGADDREDPGEADDRGEGGDGEPGRDEVGGASGGAADDGGAGTPVGPPTDDAG